MIYIERDRNKVEAWKYDPTEPIPVWVARKCHLLDGQGMTCNSPMGTLPVVPGDYVVLLDKDANMVTVVDGKAFEEQYEPLPAAGPR